MNERASAIPRISLEDDCCCRLYLEIHFYLVPVTVEEGPLKTVLFPEGCPRPFKVVLFCLRLSSGFRISLFGCALPLSIYFLQMLSLCVPKTIIICVLYAEECPSYLPKNATVLYCPCLWRTVLVS